MAKKVLSWLLSVTLVASLVPTPALAEAVDALPAADEAAVVAEDLAADETTDPAEEEATDVEVEVAEPEASEEPPAEESVDAVVDEGAPAEEGEGASDEKAVPEAEPEAEPAPEEATEPADDQEPAEAAGQDAGLELEEESSEEPAEEPADEAEPEEAESEEAAQADSSNDAFFFQDYETGNRVTTLHTSGTYLLVTADGSPYQNYLGSVYFETVGTNARGDEGSYNVSVKELEQGEDEAIQIIVLEDIVEDMDGFQLPSGTYRINIGWSGNPTYLGQRYHVINDGNFRACFDFASEGGSENNHEFSVKPYTEGATDADYDGYTDDEYVWHEPAAEQEPFTLASDTRLNFLIESDVAMGEGTMPQIESIGLWKADEPLENLIATMDDSTGELVGKYSQMYWYSLSRVQEILDEAGLSELPTWPNALNFNDDAKLTPLWERGDSELGERITVSNTTTDATVIVDRANFASAVAEDGLYFPIVKATIAGEPYTYAYFPIQVSAEGASERTDPAITTTSLPAARVGDAYTASLKARSGSVTPGTFTWAVSDGALPAGLSLDPATSTITGTPTEAGTASFTIALTETIADEPLTATRTYTLTVREAANPSTAFDQLELGQISYTPGIVWTSDTYGKATYANLRIPISIDLRDAAYDLQQTELVYMLKMGTKYDDEPVYYVWRELATDVISEDGTTLEVAAPLEKGLLVRPTEVIRIRAFLIPKTNEGEFAFDCELVDDDPSGEVAEVLPMYVTLAEHYGAEPEDVVWNDDGTTSTESQSYCFMNEDGETTQRWYGDYAHYVNMPEMPYTALEAPNITFGSWVHVPSLKFDGDQADWPTMDARIRIWPYDGTTTPTTQQTVDILPIGSWDHISELTAGAELKLAPGTYAFVVEGAADDEGDSTGGFTWVDIAGKVTGATEVDGARPKQYVVNIAPNQGTRNDPVMLGITYTDENFQYYHVDLSYEQEDGTFKNDYVYHETSWYRHVGDKDVLVATGDTVSLTASEDPLFVQVKPYDRDAAFYRTTGMIPVTGNTHTVKIDVPRKQHFSGSFTLSCESGRTPDAGKPWGVIEVETPRERGGATSFNLWAYTNPVRVDGLTSGSVVTFTPSVELDGASVSYVVPEETEDNFDESLEAPLARGTVTFEGLSFTSIVDGAHAENDGTGSLGATVTKPITLDDGNTGVSVWRVFDGEASYEVPFYQVDGSRIILEPREGYEPAGAAYEFGPATYRVIVTRYDENPSAAQSLSQKANYAVQQAFDVTLSPEKPTATIEPTTLVSRGYADVALGNSGDKPCTLLLYKLNGDDETSGELVDKGSAGLATEVRTPFLDEGDYVLYAVDSGLLTQGSDTYGTLGNLEEHVLVETLTNRGVKTRAFKVRNAEKAQVSTLDFPTWEDESVVDLAKSSVTAKESYSDKLSITMHAELAKGATLSDQARIEISTNQAPTTGVGDGFTNPKALNINNRAITINRWDNLFNNTQKMDNGNLTILLAEAKKTSADCAKFPMDMTLVIPRTDYTAIDVSISLYDPKTNTRSLIGSYHRETPQVTLNAPAIVAWQTFYVYGETNPNARVAIYLDGMRTATAFSDSYGYYSAQITLPNDVQDWDEFTVSASAQWTDANQGGHAATSTTADVVYSSTYPVVERVTLCYQSMPGEDYTAVTSYYRGMMPYKYLSLYRAEHDNEREGEEHAKMFWMAEFANGQDVGNVQMSMKLSTSTLNMVTSDKLSTVQSWIPDVKLATAADSSYYDGMGWRYAAAGPVVKGALVNSDLHAYVSKPVYLTVSPDTVEVTFDFDGELDVALPMAETTSMAPFEGYASSELSQDDLTALIDAMSTAGNVRSVTEAEATGLGLGGNVRWENLTGAADRSASLKAATPGTVDQWLLVGSEVDPESTAENSLLKVHHRVTTTSMSAAEIRTEVGGVLTEAHRVTEPFEAWLYDGASKPSGEDEIYKENYVAHAASTRTTLDESYRYYIATVDDAGSMQVETFMEFAVEGSAAHTYLRMREDKRSMTLTSWDEEHGQKVEVTYTLADDQVPTSNYAESGDLGCDIPLMWELILEAVTGSVLNGSAEVDALSSQAADEEPGLSAQDGPVAEAGGFYGGAVRDAGIAWGIKRMLGIEKVDQGTIADRRAARDWTNFDNIERVSKNGSQAKDFAKDVKVAVDGVGGAVVDGAVATGTAYATGGLTNKPVQTAVGAVASPALTGKVTNWVNETLDGWADDYNNWRKNRKYREYKNYAWRRRKKQMRPGDKGYFNRLATESPALANEFARRFKAEAAKWEKLQAKQNNLTEDPSGIVYEAVLSNPVEGATVKLYTYNSAMAGVGYDPAQFIDSEQFGIEDNPQITGSDGRYQWFVPEGYWQVRVSKKGYEPVSTGDSDAYGIEATKSLEIDGETVEADSYWMPVLPVQLDVNIPLVSLEAPGVESIVAGEDGVVVTFTKYMKPETVVPELFSVGGLAPSAVEPLDAEEAGDGSGEMYARSFKLALPEGLKLSPGLNDVTVTFDDATGEAKSYAGVAVSTDAHAEQTVELEAEAVDISAAKVSVAAQTYTGKALKPAVTVTLDGVTLTAGTDYTVAYAKNVNVGTATVTVTGKGDYTGSVSATFKIKAASLAKATVAKVADQTYTGKAIKPSPAVKVGTVALKKGTDYTLAYAKNVNAGTATITVTGKGNYTSTVSATFKIKAASLAKATVAKVADQTFTGKAIKPSPAVKLGTVTLKAGTDYTLGYKGNVNAGTATITVTGKGNYTGSVSATFKIKAASLAKATVAKVADQTFTGKAIKPAPAVKLGTVTLKKGTDYTLAYKANVNAGTATVTVTGKGNYTGTAKATFKIKPVSIAKATFAAIDDQPYTGKGRTPVPKVTFGGNALKNGTDFSLAYANNIEVSNKAQVTVTGKGNFTGTKKLGFCVAFKDVPKSHPFYQKIHLANDAGIINGYNGADYGKFGPADNITRGQIAVMLWNASGQPKATGGKSFPDVKPAYYYDAVMWASSVGVVNGYSDGNFGPNDNITREQLAVMVANYATKVGKLKVSGSKADLAKVADAGSVSGYAVGSVAWCYKRGIFVLQGGKLNAKATADRATAAQMAYDLFQLLH